MNIVKHKVLFLLLVLTLLFFHKFVFSLDQIVYPAPDIFFATYAEKALFSHSITSYNSIPLWNPYVFGGSPFLGNPTSTLFNPFNLLFSLLPVGSVFGYLFAIDSFLIGLFTYLYARIIKLDKFGALVCAISVMFSGPLITSVFAGHPILSDTFTFFPLALIFFELMIVKRKLIFAILAGFTITLMFFSGAPQIAIYEILSLLMYFFLRLAFETKNIRDFLKLSILPIIAISIGILIASVQLLPSMEFSRLSQRGESGISYDFASDFSLHPYQTLSFILPYFFGSPLNGTYWTKGNFWELNGYIGVLPLIFALLTLFIKKNKYVFVFLIIGLFAVFYAFGKYSYVFPYFFNYVPGFNNFRVPGRFLFIYVFSFSILSGIGASFLISNLINKIKSINRKILIVIPMTILSLVFFLLFIGTDKPIISIYEKYILRNSFAVGINHTLLYIQMRNDIIFFLTSLLLLYIVIVLKKKNILKISRLKVLIVFFIILDLWLFGSRFIDTKNIKNAFKPTSIINKILKDKSVYRVFDMKGEYTPLIAKNNLESVTGASPLYLKDTRDFLWSIGKHVDMPYDSFIEINEISNPIFLSLLNVKYIITNNKIKVDGLSEIGKSNSRPSYFSAQNQMYFLYKNTATLPRAYIVPNALILKDKDKTLNLIASNNFDPREYVILKELPKNARLNNSSDFKEISIRRDNFNKISLNFNLNNSGFLVLSEINYPGWTAYDNGKKTEIFNANYIFRSIYVQNGKHEITFLYRPFSFIIGGIISLVALLSCSILLYVKRFEIQVRGK